MKEIEFIDGIAGDMPEAVKFGEAGESEFHDAGHFESGEAGIDGAFETFDCFAFLAEEPFDKAGLGFEFMSNDRGADGEGVGIIDFAEELGAAVEILGVGRIGFGIVAAAAVENAIGADVEEAGAGVGGELGETVGEKRIDFEAEDGVMSFLELLNDADAVYDGLGAGGLNGGGELTGAGGINASDGAPGIKKGKARVMGSWFAEGDPDFVIGMEVTPELMPEHARAADDENSHCD